MSSAAGRKTDIPIDAALLDEAEALNLNVSMAAEGGITAAIKHAKARQWLVENAQATASSNDFIDKHGLPLEKHRPF